MVFLLTEQEKLIIIIFASSIFLLSVIVTVCIVSPICLFHKWLFKSKTKLKTTIYHPKHQLLTPESKHFQLSVVPHYGSYVGSNPILENKQNGNNNNTSIERKNSKNTLSSDNEKPRVPIKIKMMVYVENDTANTVKVHININQVNELIMREYGVEPSCYVFIEIYWYGPNKSRRKSLNNNKIAASFESSTVKRCLNPVFNEEFATSELPKSILKEGHVRVRVMDEERYANDICLGEIAIPFKQFNDLTKIIKDYELKDPKEFKGELLMELCYLPTSNRLTFTIIKATIPSSGIKPTLCYYIRALMFVNGKLTKKKKSSTSPRLNWGDNENLTFDLMEHKREETSFMIVLSSRVENTSPSSPETPGSPETGNGSRKDKHIGHYILGNEQWNELRKNSRKQISKWVKLI